MSDQEILPKPEWLYARCVRLTITSDKQIAMYVPPSQRHTVQGKQALRIMRLHLIDQGVTILSETEFRASLSQHEVAILERELATERCFHMIVHSLIIKGGHPPSKLATVYKLDEDTIRAYVRDIDKNALFAVAAPSPPSIVDTSSAPAKPAPLPVAQAPSKPPVLGTSPSPQVSKRPQIFLPPATQILPPSPPLQRGPEFTSGNGHNGFQAVKTRRSCNDDEGTPDASKATPILVHFAAVCMFLFTPAKIGPKKK